MIRWERPVAPTRHVRWTARHARGLVAASATLAILSIGLLMSVYRTDGLRWGLVLAAASSLLAATQRPSMVRQARRSIDACEAQLTETR